MIMRFLHRRLPALAAAAALAVACTACGSSSSSTSASQAGSGSAGSGSFPVTVTAADGPVHIKSRPGSIISLSPTATEMLYAIGAGRQVKAVDDDSDYPPQAPRTKLSGYTPNVEAIVAYKPDLVVISDNVDGLAKRLAAFSIPVLQLPAPAGLAGVYTEFSELGRATGHAAQAQREEASMQKQIQKIVVSVPHRAHLLTYYYELDQTYYSLTSATFIGKLLGLLGLKSIADSAKGATDGYPQLSAEYILHAQPDYLILADTLCCQQSPATVARRPGWSALTAVKKGHIIALNDDIASRWGPRIVDLLRDVATGLDKGSTR